MKKKIENKILGIEVKMKRLESEPLYYISVEWKILSAQREILAQLLIEL